MMFSTVPEVLIRDWIVPRTTGPDKQRKEQEKEAPYLLERLSAPESLTREHLEVQLRWEGVSMDIRVVGSGERRKKRTDNRDGLKSSTKFRVRAAGSRRPNGRWAMTQ